MKKHSHYYYSLIFLIIFVVDSHLIHGQKDVDSNVSLASGLKEQYADDDVASITSRSVYTFSFEKGNLHIEEVRFDSLIALEDHHNQHFARFYDGTSEFVNVLSLGSRKEIALHTTDNYYHNDNYFHSDVRVVQYSLGFARKGDIKRVQTTKEYTDPKYFTKVFFHDYFPIVRHTIDFIIPDGLDIEFRKFCFDSVDVRKTEKRNDKDGTTLHRFEMQDLEAFSTAPNIDGASRIYPHFLVLTKAYRDGKHAVRFFETTKDVYVWYKALVDEIMEDASVLEPLVTELTASFTGDEQLRRVFYWVQNNIRYIAFENGIAGYQPDACQNVYQKRYGDCKGMANLTKQMLKLAGYDARLAWLGTRQLAYSYSAPSLAVDNHMICAVKLNDTFVFLDPTEKYSAFAEYSERIQGQEVMIEDGQDFIISTIPGRKAEDNREITLRTFEIGEGQKLMGSVVEEFYGESKADMLFKINYTSKEDLEDAISYYITGGHKNFTATAIVTSDIEDRDKPLQLNYHLEVDNAVTSFDDELYVDLNHDKYLSGFEFEDDRKLDFVFPFKYALTNEISLRIPDGFRVSELPPSVHVQNTDFSFALDIKHQNNKIIYLNKIEIPNARVRAQHFSVWNDAIAQLKDSYSHQIVLKRAQ